MKRTISGMVGKGSLGHNSRSFYAENVKQEKSANNIVYCNENLRTVYAQLFGEALESYNAKQTRKDRRIDDYYKHIQNGKQEKLFHEVIFQTGNEKDTAVDSKEGALAVKVLDKFMGDFQKRNPNLRVFSAHLHMDEATPHLHIDFVPFTTGSKRGLETRVSLKQALHTQGFKGGTRESTELNQWINSEKEQLAVVMREHGIEWHQLGTNNEHLSVLDYKKQEREKEVRSLEKRLDVLKQQHIKLDEIENIAGSKAPFSNKVMLEPKDYELLVSSAQQYVAQKKMDNKLNKSLSAAKKKITALEEQNGQLEKRLKDFKSIGKQLDVNQLQIKIDELSRENGRLKAFIDSQGLNNRYQATKRVVQKSKEIG